MAHQLDLNSAHFVCVTQNQAGAQDRALGGGRQVSKGEGEGGRIWCPESAQPQAQYGVSDEGTDVQVPHAPTPGVEGVAAVPMTS